MAGTMKNSFSGRRRGRGATAAGAVSRALLALTVAWVLAGRSPAYEPADTLQISFVNRGKWVTGSRPERWLFDEPDLARAATWASQSFIYGWTVPLWISGVGSVVPAILSVMLFPEARGNRAGE